MASELTDSRIMYYVPDLSQTCKVIQSAHNYHHSLFPHINFSSSINKYNRAGTVIMPTTQVVSHDPDTILKSSNCKHLMLPYRDRCILFLHSFLACECTLSHCIYLVSSESINVPPRSNIIYAERKITQLLWHVHCTKDISVHA